MTSLSGHDAIPLERLKPVADEMLSGLTAGPRIRSRALFNASLMDRVPESADQMLGAVRADGALRHRILTTAHHFGHKGSLTERISLPPARGPVMRKLTPILGTVIALVLMVGLGVRFFGPDLFEPQVPVQQAGEVIAMPKSANAGDLMTGALKLSTGVPQFRSLFANSGSGEPALVSVNGRYYQMLTAPLSISTDMLGTKHGDVQSLTSDISLAGFIGVLSNVVPDGEAVYGVQDYSTRTLIAARVGGSMRVFQRIGYAAKTLVGEESFKDTLAIEGRVRALELSGVGIVTDGTKANSLVQVLLNDARQWSGEAIPEGEQALTIYLENSLALQLKVSGDVVEACGAWSCPQFFEGFKEAVGS
ncbi:hypothetical protein AGMMS49992_26340 [Clostridia bacterium]|nr:hypothetical protein AGMMS49992_26340 [Clostridia bacterium]